MVLSCVASALTKSAPFRIRCVFLGRFVPTCLHFNLGVMANYLRYHRRKCLTALIFSKACVLPTRALLRMSKWTLPLRFARYVSGDIVAPAYTACQSAAFEHPVDTSPFYSILLCSVGLLLFFLVVV